MEFLAVKFVENINVPDVFISTQETFACFKNLSVIFSSKIQVYFPKEKFNTRVLTYKFQVIEEEKTSSLSMTDHCLS